MNKFKLLLILSMGFFTLQFAHASQQKKFNPYLPIMSMDKCFTIQNSPATTSWVGIKTMNRDWWEQTDIPRGIGTLQELSLIERFMGKDVTSGQVKSTNEASRNHLSLEYVRNFLERIQSPRAKTFESTVDICRHNGQCNQTITKEELVKYGLELQRKILYSLPFPITPQLLAEAELMDEFTRFMPEYKGHCHH